MLRRATETQVKPTTEGKLQGATIFVCTASKCKEDGAAKCMMMLKELGPAGLQIRETGCLGPCGSGPNVLATPLPPNGAVGGRETKAKKSGSFDQPAGVCFTGIKSEEDAALLAPWGFPEAGSFGPLSMLKTAYRASQLDQVPWPILLYVGFNVIRLVINAVFGVDLLRLVAEALGKA